MGWREADFSSNDVLRRIVLLLVALAALAERAASMSAPRRRAVLGILLPAEAKAWALVIEAAGITFDAPADGFAVPGDGPDRTFDAAHLAVRLRMLALYLIMALTDDGTAGPKFARECAVVRTRTAQRLAPPVPDTS